MMKYDLIEGKIYAYIDTRFASPLRVGYFLGMIDAQKLSQSWDDVIEKEPCYVFATKPGKELWGKHNSRVPVRCLSKAWDTSEIN